MMSEEQYETLKRMAEGMRTSWKCGDAARDAGNRQPDDVVRIDNLLYGPYGHWNSLDVYYPKKAVRKGQILLDMAESARVTVTDGNGRTYEGAVLNRLPVIISIHGGGWMYGEKELYQYYCMSLAERGFAVVNFTYRLAPENAFPAEFIDVNRCMCWVAANAEKYGLDRRNVFILGDSAGGQMASWYCTLMTSPAFRAQYEKSFPIADARREAVAFTMEQYRTAGEPEDKIKDIPAENLVPDETYSFKVPFDRITVRACALNCGVYDMVSMLSGGQDEAFGAFVGDTDRDLAVKLVDSWNYQTKDFPPAFVMSASHDFLLPMAEPMEQHLRSLGAEAELHVYGKEEQAYMVHVFHVNVKLDEADQCNDDECDFFRRHLRR